MEGFPSALHLRDVLGVGGLDDLLQRIQHLKNRFRYRKKIHWKKIVFIASPCQTF